MSNISPSRATGMAPFNIYLADLQDISGREALQTLGAGVVPPSQHPGPDLEASDAATDEEAQPEGPDAEVAASAADEKGQPAEAAAAPEAAADEEAQPALSEAETATAPRFASPIMLAVIGLILLGVIGLIALISVMKRKRSV